MPQIYTKRSEQNVDGTRGNDMHNKADREETKKKAPPLEALFLLRLLIGRVLLLAYHRTDSYLIALLYLE